MVILAEAPKLRMWTGKAFQNFSGGNKDSDKTLS